MNRDTRKKTNGLTAIEITVVIIVITVVVGATLWYMRGQLAKQATRELPYAVAEGDVARVKKLLRMGADPNSNIMYYVDDQFVSNPLGIAVRNGARDIVDLLLDHGADINGTWGRAEGRKGRKYYSLGGPAIVSDEESQMYAMTSSHIAMPAPPIIWAAINGDEEIFEYLVSRGADPAVEAYNHTATEWLEAGKQGKAHARISESRAAAEQRAKGGSSGQSDTDGR